MSNQSFKSIESESNTGFSIVTVPCVGDDSQDIVSAVADNQIVLYKLVISARGACNIEIINGVTSYFSVYINGYLPVIIDLNNTPLILPTNTALEMNGIGDYQTVQITCIYKLQES